jgi:FkbM family methyltransferase
MAIHTSLEALAWAAFRYSRGMAMTALRRNPLNIPFRWSAERNAATILVNREPPRLLETEGTRKLWQTPFGNLWGPAKSDPHFIAMLTAEARMDVYRIGKPRIVFDCGANIGFWTRVALLRGAERVVGFEPDPDNAQAYRRNFEREIKDGRVILMEQGCWNKADKLWLSNPDGANPGSASVFGKSDSGHWIEVTTVDSVAKNLGLRPDFVKMDIEGAELMAIEGLRETISSCSPRIGMGTEHTEDIYDNNVKVINAIQAIDPKYRWEATEVHRYRSRLANGSVVTPYSLYFERVT